VAGQVVGIDLGTVNSCVAAVSDGHAVVLSDSGDNTIPSCLGYAQDKEIVGQRARRQLVTEPLGTVTAVKRLLGHSYESAEVQGVRERVSYPIRPSPMGGVLLEIGGRELTPVQVSARVLGRIKEVAESALGEDVERAVISVPAHFNDIQRKATVQAAEYAGLEVARLVNEPTAAAFAYGYRKGCDMTLAVYDLGGGTFDITVMRVEADSFRVLATDGDSYLGGEDFDNMLADWLAGEFQAEFGESLATETAAMLRLKEAAELAKIELTERETSRVELPYLLELPDGTRADFARTVDREKLTELSAPLVARTIEMVQRCLSTAGVRPNEIDDVLLVGGQSRMPIVREGVREFFGRDPRRDINPDEVVAMGAALYGYMLASDEMRAASEDAAEEAYEIAIREAAVAQMVLDDVEKLESDGDPDLPARLSKLIRDVEDPDLPARLDLPAARANVEGDLPVAIEGLRGQIDSLRGKAQAAIDQLIQEIREEDGDVPAETDTAFTPMRRPSAAVEHIEALSQELSALSNEDSETWMEPDPPSLTITNAALGDRLQAGLAAKLEAAAGGVNAAEEHVSEAEVHASTRKVDLIDVTSHSLGIGAVGDLMTVLIEQNTAIPCEHQRVFTTQQDGQREVEIKVYQGRASQASLNDKLGNLVLEGITPAGRMEPRIEVTFAIDVNGILAARAEDKDSGAEQSIRFEDPLGLQQAAREEFEFDSSGEDVELDV